MLTSNLVTRPFFKWAGGKYRVMHQIHKILPKGARLIEPFVGSGAVFLNTDYPRYTLNDINKDLIDTFRVLKRNKKEFIEYAKVFFHPKYNTKKNFLSLRDEFNTTEDEQLKSALFLYLNRHAFNGLVRYNLNGEFNTSFGDYKKPYFPEKEMISFIQKAHKAKFKCQDFSKTMAEAKQGDVIYCDPPYIPLSLTSSFTNYHASGFGLSEQKQLVNLAKELSGRGSPVIISNHDTEFSRELYQDADIISFNVQRFISCQGTKRNKVRELLATFN